MYPSVKTIDYFYDFRHLLQRGCKVSGTTTAELWERPSAVFQVMEVMGDFGNMIVLRDLGIMGVLGEFWSTCKYYMLVLGVFRINCEWIGRFWKHSIEVFRDSGSVRVLGDFESIGWVLDEVFDHWDNLFVSIERFWNCGSIWGYWNYYGIAWRTWK